MKPEESLQAEEKSQGDRPKRDPVEILSDQFCARIEGFRELLEVISPHVAALDQPAGIKLAIERSGLSEHGEGVLRNLFAGPDDDASSPDGDDVSEQKGTGLTSDFADLARSEPSGLVRVMRRFAQGVIAPRTSLLHGSLLTVAIASFEFLLAGLYGEHLIQFPKQLDDDEKEFSLSDLAEIGSIEEAQRVLAERRVDSFMRRGVEDWSRWAKQTLGRSFEELCLGYVRFDEVMQRRHIVVHNGGTVNRLYLERVKIAPADLPKLGDELNVSASYMDAALDELEALGYGLAALAGAKWDASHADQASAFLNSRIYDLLKGERYGLAIKLAEVGDELGQSAVRRWMIAVNGWIATKRQHGIETCRDPIESWDVTALSNDFKLAKACLLDEHDEAFGLLAAVTNESPERAGEMWDWPLLDDLRDSARFGEIFARAGYLPSNRHSEAGD